MISVTEAIETILNNATPLDEFVLPIEKASSFVTARDIVADRPLPPFDRVAMDGFAVRANDFVDGKAALTIKGQVQTGVSTTLKVTSGNALQIMTGAPCPPGADAVVKIENCEIKGNTVHLTEPKISPGLNLAQKGEDAQKGKVLVQKGSALSTASIATCASVGLDKVTVYKKPKIIVMSTGNEVVPPEQTPEPHQIRDCNSYSVRVMGQMLGCEVEFIGIAIDDPDSLSKLIRTGLSADILILSGGVSMGEFDHIPAQLEANGVEKIFHHVKVKPGKPLWFGKSPAGCYVFGLPGNPVSVQSCFRLFVEPLIKKLSGQRHPTHQFLHLELLEDLASKTPRENYIPGQLMTTRGATGIMPVKIQGSGDFSNLAKSHGLIKAPSEINILKQGTIIEFLPWADHWIIH